VTGRGLRAALFRRPSVREWRALRAAIRLELILAVRRGENLLVTLGLPVLLLVGFGLLPLLPVGAGGRAERLDALVPGIVAASIVATAFVALGIATAFERGYGVHKRLAASPFPGWSLVAAKILVVAGTVLLQLSLVAIVATILGWRPLPGLLAALGGAVPWAALGTVCFAALGILLALRLRPETMLAVANGLFAVALLGGGLLVPTELLPGPLGPLASLLPPGLLANALRSALAGGSVDAGTAVLLAGWTLLLAGATLAARPPEA
jgi:ABC-2 type transport system permease protein